MTCAEDRTKDTIRLNSVPPLCANLLLSSSVYIFNDSLDTLAMITRMLEPPVLALAIV